MPAPAHGISIKAKKNGRNPAASPPLTNSVQQNFRGFTYSGEGESLIAQAIGRLEEQDEGEEAVDDDDVQEPTTEDEAEDDQHPAGRYARRKGYIVGFDEDMHI